MASRNDNHDPAKTPGGRRAARLEAELRANLKRRKDLTRARAEKAVDSTTGPAAAAGGAENGTPPDLRPANDRRN